MNINIKSTNIELTDAVKEYALEKIGSLEKYFDNIQGADIDLGMHSTHHQKGKVFYAEVNMLVPGKKLRVVKDSEDQYKAIDKVKDHLKAELEKMKGKMRSFDQEELRGVKEYQEEDEIGN
ncbi:MAG: ribosome-associated translation inhibitor RaiA [Candidatus Magasanikbacteria bacterium]